jgi:hypothetical protein
MSHRKVKSGFMSRLPVLKSASDGAWIGFCFGMLALIFVVVARFLVPEVRSRPDALPFSTLALMYLVAGPALGFVGGALRTWLPGRVGGFVIAATLAAAATAIVLPYLPKTRSPWGPVEYSTIVLMAVTSGFFIGARWK